jgi:hypothetical protein
MMGVLFLSEMEQFIGRDISHMAGLVQQTFVRHAAHGRQMHIN